LNRFGISILVPKFPHVFELFTVIPRPVTYALTKYIEGVSANCQNIGAVYVSANKKLLAPLAFILASIVEKDFKSGIQQFHKVYLKIAESSVFIFSKLFD